MSGILINLLKISHKNGLGRQFFKLIFKNHIGHFPLTHGMTFGKSLNLLGAHLQNEGWGGGCSGKGGQCARSALRDVQLFYSLIP